MTTAAVVGSGPNGLAAAITLADAGVSVTVYEAADHLGGGARSSELTLPGLIHDECSSHHAFGLASQFAREFDLAQHGLEWAYTDVETSRTLGSDAERYRRFFSPVASRMPTVADEFLQSLLLSLGGRVETGRRVDDVRELAAVDVLMLNTGPAEAARIARGILPGRTVRGLERWHDGPAAFKVSVAVEGGIPWAYEPSRRAGTVHLSGTYEETAFAEKETARGRMPERPYVLLAQQHLADPGRAKASIVPIDAYAHVPNGFDGDASEAILAQIERFAPGTRDRIIAEHRAAPSPSRLSTRTSSAVTSSPAARTRCSWSSVRLRVSTVSTQRSGPRAAWRLLVLSSGAAWARRPRNVRLSGCKAITEGYPRR